jgi:hypothetical protein
MRGFRFVLTSLLVTLVFALAPDRENTSLHGHGPSLGLAVRNLKRDR